ncbi:MAG: hypothetical protein ACR2GF_07295 [Acidimicrobiales bacterium]
MVDLALGRSIAAGANAARAALAADHRARRFIAVGAAGALLAGGAGLRGHLTHR